MKHFTSDAFSEMWSMLLNQVILNKDKTYGSLLTKNQWWKISLNSFLILNIDDW